MKQRIILRIINFLVKLICKLQKIIGVTTVLDELKELKDKEPITPSRFELIVINNSISLYRKQLVEEKSKEDRKTLEKKLETCYKTKEGIERRIEMEKMKILQKE